MLVEAKLKELLLIVSLVSMPKFIYGVVAISQDILERVDWIFQRFMIELQSYQTITACLMSTPLSHDFFISNLRIQVLRITSHVLHIIVDWKVQSYLLKEFFLFIRQRCLSEHVQQIAKVKG